MSERQPFSAYFNAWLYGPKGYYTQLEQIGKKGDFYTSVSSSKYFGGAIANHLIRRIDSGHLTKESMVLEIGAHQGYLLADIIQFIYTLRPELLQTLSFGIIERFDALQEAQRHYFKEAFGDVIRLKHFKDPSEVRGHSGFIVANEIFDAFACEIVHDGKMAYVKEHTLEWDTPLTPEVSAICDRYSISRGEVIVGLESYGASLFACFERSEFVTFDYGEFHPRNDISARIYQSHQTYPLCDEKTDLKALYGKSDITFDVHFERLIDAFKEAGFHHEHYATQMVALNDFGLTELLEILQKNVDYETYLKEIGKVKTLINPAFLGERFKMVNFLKGA